MSKRRVLKSTDGTTITEITHLDGKMIINQAYAVRANDPQSLRHFGDRGAAETYYAALLLRRLKSG